MIRIYALILSFIISFSLFGAAHAQRLVSGLSDSQISIHSSFSGDTLTIFGNIEAEHGAKDKTIMGSFNIITVIKGPTIDRIIRKKSKQFGIWLNSDYEKYTRFSSFFWILSDTNLSDIASDEVLREIGLPLDVQPQLSLKKSDEHSEIFNANLIRLMKDEGLFGVNENAILFRSDTLFSTQIKLPANVPVGNYIAQTYLFQNGVLVSKQAEPFSVKKTGFERFLGNFAKQSPLLYGIFAVFLALFTGWLGGVAFRR